MKKILAAFLSIGLIFMINPGFAQSELIGEPVEVKFACKESKIILDQMDLFSNNKLDEAEELLNKSVNEKKCWQINELKILKISEIIKVYPNINNEILRNMSIYVLRMEDGTYIMMLN